MTSEPVDQAIAEAKRAAKELAQASAKLTRHLLSKAEAAAKDPSGSAKRVAHKVAKELEDATRDVERILKDL